MITKSTILTLTQNGLNIFKHYIPFEFKLGKNFKNPFYDDKNASCNVYYDRHNQCFKIKDFGNPDFSGDCFAFVAQIKGLDVRRDFLQVLQSINRDLNLCLDEKSDSFIHPKKTKTFSQTQTAATTHLPNIKSRAKTIENTAKPYQYAEKDFSQYELDFWKDYGISEKTLNRFAVLSLSSFQSVNKDGDEYEIKNTEKEPVFSYKEADYIKLYRPKSKLRFLYGGQLPANYCFGLRQLPNRGDILFITGGEKDVMSLYAKGFHAICFNSETSHIPTEIIEMLTHHFKHIIILYDCDETGLSASEKHLLSLAKYNLQRLILPLSGSKTEKDISDYFALGKSRSDFQQLILDLLKTKYTQTMTLIKSCEVDFENPPELSENIISVNEVPLGTQGNLLCITGGEGTGKSNYASAIAAGTLVENAY